MVKAKEELIEKICYVGGCNNTVHYREIYREKDRSFKIEINTDSSNPSPAYLYILDGSEWKCLYTIPSTLKQVGDIKYNRNQNGVYYQKQPMTALGEFKHDSNILKETGRQILWG